MYASFDIECVPKTGTRFPFAERTDDQIAQIGVSMGICGRGVVDRIVICLGQTDDAELDGDLSTLSRARQTREVLQCFADLLHTNSVDILMGYNIFKFDIQYICDRAMRIEAFGDFTDYAQVERIWVKTRQAYEQYELVKDRFDKNMAQVSDLYTALNQCPFVNLRVPQYAGAREPAVPYNMRILSDYETRDELALRLTTSVQWVRTWDSHSTTVPGFENDVT